MSDLLSFICPSCGAKIEITPGTNVLECRYCGTKHIVKGEAGSIIRDSHNSCPRCGKNDRVEKVSAICSTQTQRVVGREEKVEVFTHQGRQYTKTFEVPVTKIQTSNLAQSLNPPPKPSLIPVPSAAKSNNYKTFGIVLIVLSIIAGLPCSLSMLFSQLEQAIEASEIFASIMVTVLFCGLPTLLALGVGIFLVMRGKKVKQQKAEDYEKEVERVNNENEEMMNRWKKATQRWESLYYCFRDDCIFIPGDNSSAPVQKMYDYLYGSAAS